MAKLCLEIKTLYNAMKHADFNLLNCDDFVGVNQCLMTSISN